jgi:hypothetical protein
MKKPRKKPKPELRVRIDAGIFKALKIAVARDCGVNSVSMAEVVEAALASYGMVKREMADA